MRRVFYDVSCPACKRIVKRIESLKNKKLFKVSSLDGKNAKLLFQGNYTFLRKKNSKMVLLEGQKIWIKGNAMLRPYWIIGGKWKVIGIFSFLPGFILNPFISLWVNILRFTDKKLK